MCEINLSQIFYQKTRVSNEENNSKIQGYFEGIEFEKRYDTHPCTPYVNYAQTLTSLFFILLLYFFLAFI